MSGEKLETMETLEQAATTEVIETTENNTKKEKNKKAKEPRVKREKKVRPKKERKPKKERAPKTERAAKKTKDGKKVKASREKLEIPFYRGIAAKMIVCFLVPVVGVAVLGSVSYQKSSDAIVNTYKESVQQTTDMMEQYISLVATSEKDEFKSYLTEQDLKKYFGGLMGVVWRIQRDVIISPVCVINFPSMISFTVFISLQIRREVLIPEQVNSEIIFIRITRILRREQKLRKPLRDGLYTDRIWNRMMSSE